MKHALWLVVVLLALGGFGACVRDVVLVPPSLDGGTDSAGLAPDAAGDAGVDDGGGGD